VPAPLSPASKTPNELAPKEMPMTATVVITISRMSDAFKALFDL